MNLHVNACGVKLILNPGRITCYRTFPPGGWDEYLTPAEVEKLIKAAGSGRYGMATRR